MQSCVNLSLVAATLFYRQHYSLPILLPKTRNDLIAFFVRFLARDGLKVVRHSQYVATRTRYIEQPYAYRTRTELPRYSGLRKFL